MTVSTRVIKLFLAQNMANYVPLSDGLRLQVLPSVAHLPRCQKHHFGAFIQDQQLLVVWDDQPKSLMQRAAQIESSLMRMIWGDGETLFDAAPAEKKSANVSAVKLGSADGTFTPRDLEGLAEEKRPTLLLNPIMVGLTLTLLITALGLGWAKLAQEVAIDG